MQECASSPRCAKWTEHPPDGGGSSSDKNRSQLHWFLQIVNTSLQSTFCAQPVGDAITRSATFDSFSSGCIPVFFDPRLVEFYQALVPNKDFRAMSVLVPKGEILKGVTLESFLNRISEAEVRNKQDVLAKYGQHLYISKDSSDDDAVGRIARWVGQGAPLSKFLVPNKSIDELAFQDGGRYQA